MAPPSQPWADSPLQLIRTPFGSKDLRRGKAHGAHYIAQQMVHLHNSTIRLLNSIYNQAPYVRTPDDIQAFLAYIKHWHDEMYHHHMVEERLLFPRLEALIGQEGSMEANKEQHEAFEPGLKALGAYATSTKVEDYSGKRVQELIDDFGAILATHLADEIPTLIALENCDDKTIRKIWNEVFWFVLRTADPVSSSPNVKSIPYSCLESSYNCQCSWALSMQPGRTESLATWRYQLWHILSRTGSFHDGIRNAGSSCLVLCMDSRGRCTRTRNKHNEMKHRGLGLTMLRNFDSEHQDQRSPNLMAITSAVGGTCLPQKAR